MLSDVFKLLQNLKIESFIILQITVKMKVENILRQGCCVGLV